MRVKTGKIGGGEPNTSRGYCRNRVSVSKAPVGVINLNLPISVLISESSIDRKGVLDRENGTCLLIIELTAFETQYAVDDVLKHRDVLLDVFLVYVILTI